MDIEHGTELPDRKTFEGTGVVDSRVVDYRVEAAKRLDSCVDNALRGMLFGDRGITGHRLPAGICDFADNVLGRSWRRSLAVDLGAMVSDDHLCALGGEKQGVASPQATARSGDDNHATIKA